MRGSVRALGSVPPGIFTHSWVQDVTLVIESYHPVLDLHRPQNDSDER